MHLTAEQLVAIVGLLVGTGGIGTLGIREWLTRVGTRGERKRTDEQKAWQAYDKEARRRRRIEEHASKLRRMLIEAPCINTDTIPDWPAIDTTNQIPTQPNKGEQK